MMLTLDFKEDADASEGLDTMAADDDDGPDVPVVDIEVQNELMSMTDPFARLDSIDQLAQQAAGEALPEGEVGEGDDGMDAQGSAWFECDLQNLRILKAITLDGMDLSKDAIKIWEECIQFTT